jgi:hypothetical protein
MHVDDFGRFFRHGEAKAFVPLPQSQSGDALLELGTFQCSQSQLRDRGDTTIIAASSAEAMTEVQAELHTQAKSNQAINRQLLAEEFGKLPPLGAADRSRFLCLLLYGHGQLDLPGAQNITRDGRVLPSVAWLTSCQA